MDFFIILCYIICAFGACNVIAFGSGPFRVFERFRNLTDRISSHFGEMFTCMMCLPANFGWIFSLINLLWIPIAITPFNIILSGLGLSWWWLIVLCDGAFTSGIVWLLYRLDEFLEPKQETLITDNINKTKQLLHD